MHYFLSPHDTEDEDLLYHVKMSWKQEWNSLLTKIVLLTVGIKGKAQFHEAMPAERISL